MALTISIAYVMNAVLLQYISHSTFCYVWALLFVWVLNDSMILVSDLKASDMQVEVLKVQVARLTMHRIEMSDMNIMLQNISQQIAVLKGRVHEERPSRYRTSMTLASNSL